MKNNNGLITTLGYLFSWVMLMASWGCGDETKDEGQSPDTTADADAGADGGNIPSGSDTGTGAGEAVDTAAQAVEQSCIISWLTDIGNCVSKKFFVGQMDLQYTQQDLRAVNLSPSYQCACFICLLFPAFLKKLVNTSRSFFMVVSISIDCTI